jgi:hypothetical protein
MKHILFLLFFISNIACSEYLGEPVTEKDPISNTYWIGQTITGDEGSWMGQGTTFIHVLNDGTFNASGYHRSYWTKCLTFSSWSGTMTKIANKTYFSNTGGIGGHLILVGQDFKSMLSSLVTRDTSVVESNQYVRRNKMDVENIQRVLNQFLCQ